MGLGIVATGIVRGNIAVGLFAPGGESGIGISATGVITGNYVSGNKSGGIFAGQGSTVIGNTVMSGGFFLEWKCNAPLT
jgi:hypothetical protein